MQALCWILIVFVDYARIYPNVKLFSIQQGDMYWCLKVSTRYHVVFCSVYLHLSPDPS